MGKNVGKTVSKNITRKYSQKLLDHATDAFNIASKSAIRKISQATGDLVVNKVVGKITKTASSKSITPIQKENAAEKLMEIPKKDVYPQKKRQKFIDEL